MNALIITEGSAKSGQGHLTRCLAFSQYLASRGHQTIWLIDGDEVARNFIDNNRLQGAVGNWHDLEFIDSYAKQKDLVVVDSYHADASIYDWLSKRFEKCLWIDDYARLEYPRGFVLNPNPLVTQMSLQNGNAGVNLLSGFSFQFLRSEFSVGNSKSISKNIQRILIVMGGADIKKLTPAMVGVAQRVFPNAMISAVVVREAQRREWAGVESETCTILSEQNAEEMRGLMRKNDIGIFAGGQILCEAACAGLPSIAVGVAENQRSHMEAIAKTGSTLIAGWYTDEDLSKKAEEKLHTLSDYLLRCKMSQLGRQSFDGLGCMRTVEQVMGWSVDLHIRKARLEDMEAVWAISNAPGMREFFINQDNIPWSEHCQWYASMVNRGDVQFYVVANNEGDVVGQIRYVQECDFASVSISLLKMVQGRGYASRLLLEADSLLKDGFPQVKKIIAEVAPGNKPSLFSFIKAGYKVASVDRMHSGRQFNVLEKIIRE